VIVYSPLERGLLAGTVPPDRRFPPGDHRASHRFFTPENRRRVMDSLDKVRPIAEKHGVSLAQMVINWTIQEPGITAALVGARNAEQAEHNAKALNFKLTPEERAEIRHAFDATSAAMM
jgi:aryl-alcohol dehydrogenase-like predicted oxidoreductase